MDEKPKPAFDAQKFLDEYQDNLSTSLKKNQSATESVDEVETPPPESRTKNKSVASPKKKIGTKQVKEDIKGTSSSPEVISDMASFIDEYLVERVDSRFSRSGRQVTVDSEYHEKISMMKTLLGNRFTINGYIHNVLTKHFSEYSTQIEMLLENPNEYKNR